MKQSLLTRICMASILGMMVFQSGCNYGTKNITYTTPPNGSTTNVVTVPPNTGNNGTVNNYVPPNDNGSGNTYVPPANGGNGNYYVPPAGGTATVPNTNTYVPADKPHLSLTFPSRNPFLSADSHVQVCAHADNVMYATDIQITVNGTPSTSWYFNPADGSINGDFNLPPGNNVITFMANNALGSDAFSEYVQFNPPVGYPTNTYNTGDGYAGPLITITGPSTTSPYTSSSNTILLLATMMNVNSMNEIQLKQNGVSVGNYTFDPYSKELQFNATLYPGNNYFYLMASNASGADGKSLTVYYSPSVVLTGNTYYAPNVRFTDMTNPYNTTSSNVNVTAEVDNVTDPGMIQVRVNGMNVQNFSFDPNSHYLQFAMNANAGNNYVYVRASNAAGTDSKFMNVVYSGQSMAMPEIRIVNPRANPALSSSGSVLVNAFIENVYNSNQIQVRVNGANYPNFNYYPPTHKLEFNAMLNSGGNTVHISARNSAGNAEQSLQVVYNAPAVASPIVTIYSPISNPFNSASPTASVSAHVLNINSQSDVQVKLNGNPFSNFVYNSTSQVLQVTVPLSIGINTVQISASNSGGSDSRSISLNYTPAANKPVVTFLNPSSSPYTTANAVAAISASITNINSQRDVQLRVNGAMETNFTYNSSTHQLQYNATLNPGTNHISISATNTSGADTRVMEVVYNASPATPKPVVTVLTPASVPFTTPANSATVVGMVLNVNAQSAIQVQVNGAPYSNFSYDVSSHDVRFNTPLNPGNNYIVISASNSAGSASQSFDIISSPAPAPRPSVTLTSPTRLPFATSTGNITVQASVTNVSARNQLEVTVNGTAVNNFNYNPSTGLVDCYAVLRPGRNDFTITATNTSGTDRKDAEVDYTANSGTGTGSGTTPKPVINIVNPATTPFTTTSASFTLNGFIENVSVPSDVHITLNNNPVTGFNFNPASHALNYTTALHPGMNSMVITASNAGGTDSKTVVVTHTPPPPPPAGTAPVISFTAPTQAGFNTVDPNYPVTAMVDNMSGSNGIMANINSLSVPFTYDPVSKVLTIRGHLVVGINDIHITATNSFGSDSKTASLKLSHQISTPAGNPPMVTISNPFSSPFTTSDVNFVVTAIVQNVNGNSDISVTNNGRAVTFNYNAGNKQVTVNGPLNAGMNNFVIKATTAAGTDNRSASVNYAPVISVPAVSPVVQFVSPVGNPAKVNAYTVAVSVMITGISGIGDVKVKVNNAMFNTGLNYNPANHMLTFNAAIVPGANTIEVSASTRAGSDSKTLNIQSTTKGKNEMTH